MNRARKWTAISLGLIAAVSAAIVVLWPYSLWVIVHDVCAPDDAATGSPWPCARLASAGKVAILKAPGSRTHFLLVPTDRIHGIEDLRLYKDGAPNYWAHAWAARDLIDKSLNKSLPPDFVGMAINSQRGRTQNQLHIHIDCVRPDVLTELEAHSADIGAAWSDIRLYSLHQNYRVRRIYSANLDETNPFLSLYRGDSVARGDMADETLAVIGMGQPGGKDGFIMLSQHATRRSGYRGFSEELLDHRCRIKTMSLRAFRPALAGMGS